MNTYKKEGNALQEQFPFYYLTFNETKELEMNLEKYKEGFLQHLQENDLYLNDYSWGDDNFTDPYVRFLFSLYLLTVSQLESVKLVSDLPFATGEQLDRIADVYDIVRNVESDASLRNRILSRQREVLK